MCREQFRWFALVTICAFSLGVFTETAAAAPVGGTLNPPPGEPRPTSHTLNELFEQTQDLSGTPRGVVPNTSDLFRLFPTYLIIEDIEGESMDPDGKPAIAVLSISHGVEIQVDAQTGQSTGRRQHKPLTVTKPIDKASPLLMINLITNAHLREVKIPFYHKHQGETVKYFEITLENAVISSINTSTTAAGPLEEVSFVYEEITWTAFGQDGGSNVETTDDVGGDGVK